MKRKHCKKCGIEKFISEFHKDNHGKFGVRGTCKLCKRNYNKKYWKDNKPRLSKYKLDYFANYPWVRTFYAIKQRCNYINAINYKDYGGKGIK